MFGNAALQKQGAFVRVQAGCQPIDHHFVDVFLDDFSALVMRGQGVPVGYKIKTLHFRLQAHPVFQGAVVMAQVQGAGGTHAGEYAFCHGDNCSKEAKG